LPDSNGISRKGSGFRVDQKIGSMSSGPVKITMRTPQIVISSHGLRANTGPSGKVHTNGPHINHATNINRLETFS
jgi:hypothetical protein